MSTNWKNKFWSDKVLKTVIIQSLPKGQRGITKVYFVEDLGNTPAKCLRSTGECWVSLKHWRKLKFEHKVFILLHENEHILQDTSDELAVDREAHKKYMQMGYSLKQSIEALTKVLTYTTKEHDKRTVEQMIRAAVYDVTVNKNKNLETYLKS